MKVVTSKFINQVLEDSLWRENIGVPTTPLMIEIVFDLDNLIYNQLSQREKIFYGFNEKETNA